MLLGGAGKTTGAAGYSIKSLHVKKENWNKTVSTESKNLGREVFLEEVKSVQGRMGQGKWNTHIVERGSEARYGGDSNRKKKE